MISGTVFIITITYITMHINIFIKYLLIIWVYFTTQNRTMAQLKILEFDALHIGRLRAAACVFRGCF